MKIIAPSMLSCDFGKLVDEIEMVNKSEAGWFHLDIMDGVFVPNITFGTPILKVFKKYATKHLDAHLMIINPENYIEKFIGLKGAKLIAPLIILFSVVCQGSIYPQVYEPHQPFFE